jgi:hypothetical protein
MTIKRIDRLELDIDTRIGELWAVMWEDFPDLVDDAETRKTVAVFMRAAYGRGYMDALKDKGELCREHGYRLPAEQP